MDRRIESAKHIRAHISHETARLKATGRAEDIEARSRKSTLSCCETQYARRAEASQ
jgi:hypothetical protein